MKSFLTGLPITLGIVGIITAIWWCLSHFTISIPPRYAGYASMFCGFVMLTVIIGDVIRFNRRKGDK